MFLLPFDGNRLYPDLSVVSHIGNSSSFSQKRDPLLLSRSPLAQMLLTYAPELVQSLRLPPVKQMMQWLAQAVEYSPNLVRCNAKLFFLPRRFPKILIR